MTRYGKNGFVIIVDEITQMKHFDLLDLETGNIVVEDKNGTQKSFVVSKKDNETLVLTHYGADGAKNVNYAKQESGWTFESESEGGGNTLKKYTVKQSDINIVDTEIVATDNFYEILVSGEYYLEMDYRLLNPSAEGVMLYAYPNFISPNEALSAYYNCFPIFDDGVISHTWFNVMKTKYIVLLSHNELEVEAIATEGSSSELAGLKIGLKTWDIAKAKVYRHRIRFSNSDYVEIFNTNSEAFTATTFAKWLYENGHTTLLKSLFSTGTLTSGNSKQCYPSLQFFMFNDKSILCLNYGNGYYSTNGTNLTIQEYASAVWDNAIGSTHNRRYLAKFTIVDNQIEITSQFADKIQGSTSISFVEDIVEEI